MGKAPKKRGTVYWSPAKKKWIAMLPAGPDGKRPYRTADSQDEAVALLKRLEAERAAGRDLSRKAETVKELVQAHLDAVGGQQRPSTRKLAAGRSRHIIDAIGAMKIDQVSLETVQGLANKLIKTLSPAITRAILQMLHSAYEAVIPERVARNPVDWKRLKLRKSRPAERQPLDDDQLRALLAAADDQVARGANVRYAIFVWLAAFTGMRRGEIAGSTWRDVDWKKGELKVRTQVALAEDDTYQTGQELKTPESVRAIPLGPRLLARLRQHWEMQQAERKLRGVAWKEHGMIVCNEQGAPITDLNIFNNRLARLARAARLPHVFPHLLRHTCASLLDDEGYSEAVIASILGHRKRGGTTTRYTHALERGRRAAMVAIEARILGAAEAAKEAR